MARACCGDGSESGRERSVGSGIGSDRRDRRNLCGYSRDPWHQRRQSGLAQPCDLARRAAVGMVDGSAALLRTALAGMREAVRRTLSLPKLPPISADALTAAGLSANDIGQIRQILDGYHHTNALALVVLSALLERDEPGAAKPIPLTDTPPPSARTELPPLPAMATLQPAVQRLIAELNSFGEDGAPFLIASMYRHLAYWPSFLAIIRTLLAPLQADQSLVALSRRARAVGRAHGRVLAPQLRPLPPPPSIQDALASCRLFVEHPIARMTGICALIRDAIGDTTRPGEP